MNTVASSQTYSQATEWAKILAKILHFGDYQRDFLISQLLVYVTYRNKSLGVWMARNWPHFTTLGLRCLQKSVFGGADRTEGRASFNITTKKAVSRWQVRAEADAPAPDDSSKQGQPACRHLATVSLRARERRASAGGLKPAAAGCLQRRRTGRRAAAPGLLGG